MEEDLRQSSVSTDHLAFERAGLSPRLTRAAKSGGQQSSPVNEAGGNSPNMGRRFSLQPSTSNGRRMSKSITKYVSPYSFWKNLSLQKEENSAEKSQQQPAENTYRMEPKSPFPVEDIKRIIEFTLKSYLRRNTNYKTLPAGHMVKFLSSNILGQVKKLNTERYKIVCLVNIGSKNNSSIQIASRCLWNNKSDTFASVNFENSSLFVSCVVYGVYYE